MDSVYFVHGEPGVDHGTWPRSIEFQIQENDTGDLYALAAQITVNARLDGKRWLYDPEGNPTLFVQKLPVGNRCVKGSDAEKPNGEWNTLELFCVGDSSVHVVNGIVVMRLQHAQRLDTPAPAPLQSGRISLETEGAEVYFREIEITPIEAFPPNSRARSLVRKRAALRLRCAKRTRETMAHDHRHSSISLDPFRTGISCCASAT